MQSIISKAGFKRKGNPSGKYLVSVWQRDSSYSYSVTIAGGFQINPIDKGLYFGSYPDPQSALDAGILEVHSY